VKVSTVAHPTVTEFATRKIGLKAVVAAEGRALFVADENTVQRAVLNELGLWVDAAPLPLPFQPRDIAVKDQQLLGISGDQLLRASWKAPRAGVDSWQAQIWVPAARLVPGEAGTIYAPQGDFGVQEYVPTEPSVAPATGVPPSSGWGSLTIGGTMGTGGVTQLLISGGTNKTNPEELSVKATGVITSSNGASPVLLVSGSITMTGGTISTITDGTLRLSGSNMPTRLLISSGSSQTNPEGFTFTVSGITPFSNGAVPLLGTSGTFTTATAR
jgi:hypothetical protein